MRDNRLKIETGKSGSTYEITVATGLLKSAGTQIRRRCGNAADKVAVVSNRRVYDLYGTVVEASLRSAGFDVRAELIGDGERFKSLRTAENLLKFLSLNGFSRTDAVLALGGGVVGDVAGFAASVYLRGIPYFQGPTTLLAMIDSSVGGKTGVNTGFGKNLVGSFYQPAGVIADVSTLETLPARELTAGMCEAVKQGAVAGRDLLSLTSRAIGLTAATSLSASNLGSLVAAQIGFKAQIVAGDEREDVKNVGPRSRKVLNFGHTLAHALEKVTNYRYLRHGEAVGYGVMFAAELSKNLELLPQNQVTLLNDVVRSAGRLPPIGHLNPSDIAAALDFDKKNLGGSIQWVLLRGIGRPVIYSGSKIPRTLLQQTIRSFLSEHGR